MSAGKERAGCGRGDGRCLEGEPARPSCATHLAKGGDDPGIARSGIWADLLFPPQGMEESSSHLRNFNEKEQ